MTGKRRARGGSLGGRRRRGPGGRFGTRGLGARGLVVALMVLALAVGAGVGSWLAVRGGGGHGPARVASTDRQTTVLVMLRGSGGRADAADLLAYDSRTGQASETLVPTETVANVPGYGSQPLSKVLPLPNGARLLQTSVADLLGITVDGSWSLDHAALGRLVDAVGGVRVDVDTPVVTPRPGGGSTVVVSAGQQRLDGSQAVAFATYQGSGEAPTDRLPRLQAVLDAALGALPRDSARAATLLRGLGPGSVAALPGTSLAGFLTAYAGAVGGDNLVAQLLPVVPLDTGGPVAYRIDAAKVTDLVRSQLADSVPPGGREGQLTVYIKNAVGTAGLGASVRDRLAAAGVVVVGDSNQLPFGRAASAVLVGDASARSLADGRRVAQALGLDPSSAVQVSDATQSVADVIVVIGRDYRP